MSEEIMAKLRYGFDFEPLEVIEAYLYILDFLKEQKEKMKADKERKELPA